MKRRVRIPVVLEVNLDQVPGLFHDPTDWLWFIEQQLTKNLDHYSPAVTFGVPSVHTKDDSLDSDRRAAEIQDDLPDTNVEPLGVFS